MSLRDSVRAKMMEAEGAAVDLDVWADYDDGKVIGVYLKALCPGGKTYSFQINGNDPEFQSLVAVFTKVIEKRREDARAVLKTVGL